MGDYPRGVQRSLYPDVYAIGTANPRPRRRQRTGYHPGLQAIAPMPPRRRKVAYRVPGVQLMAKTARHYGPARVSYNRRRIYRPQGIGRRTGGFTGIERKFYDTKNTGTALIAPTNAAGGELDESATVCLNTIVQGDGENQRDGRVATINSCYVKGIINIAEAAAATGDPSTKIYLALVLDTQTNGAQLNSEDVFTNHSATGALASSPMRQMQFTQRFRVLDTFECDMGNPNAFNETGATGGAHQMGLVQAFSLSSNLTFRTQYSGTTETVANITDNSLHVIGYCSNVVLAPTVFYNARVRFVG